MHPSMILWNQDTINAPPKVTVGRFATTWRVVRNTDALEIRSDKEIKVLTYFNAIGWAL